jgi:hypothetical protein
MAETQHRSGRAETIHSQDKGRESSPPQHGALLKPLLRASPKSI